MNLRNLFRRPNRAYLLARIEHLTTRCTQLEEWNLGWQARAEQFDQEANHWYGIADDLAKKLAAAQAQPVPALDEPLPALEEATMACPEPEFFTDTNFTTEFPCPDAQYALPAVRELGCDYELEGDGEDTRTRDADWSVAA